MLGGPSAAQVHPTGGPIAPAYEGEAVSKPICKTLRWHETTKFELALSPAVLSALTPDWQLL